MNSTRTTMFLPGSSIASPHVRRWLRVSPLGSGSFGSVSLALNLDDGRLFAVKSTPACSSSSSPELSALENELSILQNLHSPRIIQCLGGDYSLQNGSLSLYIFLEHMEGGSIADLVKKSGGRLDEGRVRSYTREIVEGLRYLHEQGIVHSDIKGQNILLGSSGVKIADFGAARRLQGTTEKEEEEIGGYFRGTPLWMAPEVVQGVEQGCPSDIWSLGCTVVEMLQGRPPLGTQNGHTLASLAAVLFKIGCSHENPPLQECVSPEARDFLSKCLQRDPKDRWTAMQLLGHPFVKEQAKEEWDYLSQASPRSTFDFFGSEESDSELDNMSAVSFDMPIEWWPIAFTGAPCCEKKGGTARVHELEVEACDWVTVRGAKGWTEDRNKPFMRGCAGGGGGGGAAAGEVVVVRKGRQASLDSVAFLANRMSRAVVG